MWKLSRRIKVIRARIKRKGEWNIDLFKCPMLKSKESIKKDKFTVFSNVANFTEVPVLHTRFKRFSEHMFFEQSQLK